MPGQGAPRPSSLLRLHLPDNPPPRDLAAALADRYAIERELGAGGMATVYLTRDVKHDRLVALKVLHPDLVTLLDRRTFVQSGWVRLDRTFDSLRGDPRFDRLIAAGAASND